MSGYERRIGRYGPSLARAMTGLVELRSGARVLDVGCGSGALTERLAALVGAENVSGLDPSPADVQSCRERVPGATIELGWAEDLPYPDGAFDATLAQLLVHLVDDAPAAAAEMRRVTREGEPVVTCVWDFAGGMTVLRAFWDAGRAVGAPGVERHDQGGYVWATPGELFELWRGAGMSDVDTGELTASARYSDFDDLWQPMIVPDGTPGRFLAELEPDTVDAVRARLFDDLGRPARPFELSARAWYVRGRA